MLICYIFNPDSVFKSVPPNGSEPTWQTSMWYSDIIPLIYVNKTIYMVICISSRFMSIILWPRTTQLVPRYLKMYVVSEGPGAILWVLRHFLSVISKLLVVIWHLAKTSWRALFLPPSDACVRCLCFLYLLYTSLKLFIKTLLRINLKLRTHYKLLLISK